MRVSGYLFAALILVGCATDSNRFQNVPSAKLCIDYLSIDGGSTSKNILDVAKDKMDGDAWSTELKRRGEDCSNPNYIAAARDRVNARARAAEAARPINCTTTSTGGGNSTTTCR